MDNDSDMKSRVRNSSKMMTHSVADQLAAQLLAKSLFEGGTLLCDWECSHMVFIMFHGLYVVKNNESSICC